MRKESRPPMHITLRWYSPARVISNTRIPRAQLLTCQIAQQAGSDRQLGQLAARTDDLVNRRANALYFGLARPHPFLHRVGPGVSVGDHRRGAPTLCSAHRSE